MPLTPAKSISGCSAGGASAPASLSKKKEMKQFSALVRVPDAFGAEQVKLANLQWEQLLEQWQTSGVYVLSFALPGESYTVSGRDKTVNKKVILSGNLRVISNIVLQTETMEQAVALAKSCPVLAYGGAIEVREIPKPN